MIDTRANAWLARLQLVGPTWLTWLLAALILLELARLAYGLVRGAPVESPQPVVASQPLRPRQPAVNVAGVINNHLFGVAENAPVDRDPANAPPSSANLMLAGTIATQDPRHGIAIISDGGGPSKVFGVGDNISGAALHSVFLDHVILDRSGALETLTLPKQILMSAPRPPSGRRQPGADAHTTQAVDSIRKMVQQDPGILDQVMRVVPSYDSAAGKMRGFRAYPGRNRQIFAKLGLKPGDLVTAVNGTALDDPQRSQEVFNTIQNSDRVTIAVERGGQKQEITLNIAQVAAQATKDLDDSSPPPGGAPAGAPPATSVPPDSTQD